MTDPEVRPQLPHELPADGWYESRLAPNPGLATGPGTNSYLIGHGEVAVIDPGCDDSAHLTSLIAGAEARGGRITMILVTHLHPDHLGGAAELSRRTGATVYSGKVDPEKVVRELLKEGDTIEAGGVTLDVLHTPGHTASHLGFHHPESGVLFTGDTVIGTGTVVIAPPDGDMADYFATLRRLRELNLTRLLPGHGTVMDSPYEKLEEYITHRLMREEQVLVGLRSGRTIIPALVADIYRDVNPALHRLASLSVEAHLLKLEREGRIISIGGEPRAWRLVE